ncbi:hypothetical protein LCGC14_2945690, partial [marine sediment metagenome]
MPKVKRPKSNLSPSQNLAIQEGRVPIFSPGQIASMGGGTFQGPVPLGADVEEFRKRGVLVPKGAETGQAISSQTFAGISLADRQELADARARQAGIEPRLLEPESGAFSARRAAEIAAGLTGLEPSAFLEQIEAAEAKLAPSQLQQELLDAEGNVVAPELVGGRLEAVIGKPEGRPDAVE